MNDVEKRTVSKMIGIYCRSVHKTRQTLCPECTALEIYAHNRLESCKFGEDKPDCRHCPVHCYKKDMKVRIQTVMRFSGPRMLLYAPADAIKHIVRTLKYSKTSK